MKAIAFDSFGPSTVLKVQDLPTPKVQSTDVLIRISHTSVNPVDWKIREGYLQNALPHLFPIIPGWDVAGVVEAVGTDVKDFKVGDKVWAYARKPEVQGGTYAEYVVLPETSVAFKPDNISPAEAAAVPLVALTAYQALHRILKVKAGDKVLVTAGAGGVGSFAIQFAKVAGAFVATTASKQNHGYVKELGADLAIDYQTEDVVSTLSAAVPEGFDVVFDAAGKDALTQGFKLLKEKGKLVSIVDTPSADEAKAKQAEASYWFVEPNGKELTEIGDLIATTKVLLPEISIRSVKDAAAAQDENAKRHVRGKIVLKIDF